MINFKRKHNIRQRQVTRYVSRRKITTLQEIEESAKRFQHQTKNIITAGTIPPHFIINTGQTGCEYRTSIKRSLLSHKGEKATQIAIDSIFKMTHSYTAQYLIPKVFICLQELKGSFGLQVQNIVESLMNQYENVFITCTKSGKLTTPRYKEFLENVLKPYVEKNEFCLMIDSWSGQTDNSLYNDLFYDNENNTTCTLKVVPLQCTSICLPCDVYFYRQVKILLKQMQNSTFILQENRSLHSREDAIKMHSLIHNQLSAPIFEKMVQYALYASGLTKSCEIFLNVHQVCFPPKDNNKEYNYEELSFITCAWCEKRLCFRCFYDNYHPSVCNVYKK
ncbi:hypothetical protein ANTPLA_LOCUS1961 [Anthophora plagiata]